VLPASSWAEYDATYVNAKGLAQVSQRAIQPQGDSLPAWKLIVALARSLDLPLGYVKLGELRAAMQGGARPEGQSGTATRGVVA
jgi:predicted molibdopterin-dependent oxidoreductase YjgC